MGKIAITYTESGGEFGSKKTPTNKRVAVAIGVARGAYVGSGVGLAANVVCA